jgi:hypothetical protein
MKKVIVGGLLAGGAMVVGAGLGLGAGVAKADTYGHVGDLDGEAVAMEMQAHGWVQTPSQARTMAIEVCEHRLAGYTEMQTIGWIGFPGVPASQRTQVEVAAVISAEFHFCPNFLGYSVTPSDVSYVSGD